MAAQAARTTTPPGAAVHGPDEERPPETGGRSRCVRKGGFEPPRPFGHWHLKPARLPFRHLRVTLA